MKMIASAILTVSAVVGMALSAYMTAKYYRLSGRTPEQSVVQTRYARVWILPNSLYGLIFYAGIAAIAITHLTTGRWILLLPAAVAAVAAAIFSIYLAWSLIFRLKQPCPICFTSHILNFIIAAVLLAEVL